MSLLHLLVFKISLSRQICQEERPQSGCCTCVWGSGSIREMTAEVKDLKGRLEGRQLKLLSDDLGKNQDFP